MLKKVLIANRSEIALRVIRACQELEIPTVAVYSDADSEALHVRHAEEAVHIGPASAAKSYLNFEAIFDAARETGADAIHPGYGFLAENAKFATACRSEGLVFIGPTPEAMEKTGDKAFARKLAMQSGVPVVPGTEGTVTTEEAFDTAEEVGYPVMIKAAAGGGGQGIRVVHDADELNESVRAAMRDARAAFGEDTIYLEKFLVGPRHVEVQVMGDQDGNVIHLYERECSMQRRRQKVLEEAPSPAISPETRKKMTEAAVSLAQAAEYANAGTVEFLVDQDQNFYFIEMNTRIQVEHPVTEMLTGVDLVKEQIRVASGEPLSVKELPTLRGHVIECRINAEDPARSFQPSPGRIDVFHPPGGPGVRLDTHVYAGYTVPPYYDSLLAKLVCQGRDRQ